MVVNKRFSEENSSYFHLTLGEKNLKNKLHNIFNSKEMDGIYCLVGDRGNGKTSLKEMAKMGLEKTLFIEIQYYMDKENIYLNILNSLWLFFESEKAKELSNFNEIKEQVSFLLYVYSREIVEESYISSAKKNEKIREKNKKRFDRIKFLVGHKSNTPESLPVSLSGEALLESYVSAEHKEIERKSDIDELKKTLNVKKFLTFQWKQEQIISVLQRMSSELNIILIIDELDKLSFNEFRNLIFENKTLFLDSDITTLLICDLISGIEIEENLKEYISDFIVVNKMTFREYLIKRSNMKGIICGEANFLNSQNEFYITEGNNRKLVSMSMNDDNNFSIEAVALFYNIFCMSGLYKETVDIYKGVLRKYTKELLNFVKNSKLVTMDQYKDFYCRFIKKNNLVDTNFKNLLENYLSLKPFCIDNSFFYENYISSIFSTIEYSVIVEEENSKMLNYDKITEEYKEFRKKYHSFIRDKFNGNEKMFFDSYLNLIPNENNISHYRNKKKEFKKEENGYSYDHVEKAEKIIKNKKNKIIGMSLFLTEGNQSVNKYINGFIYENTDFEKIIVHEFIGYPGLTSHKPQYIEKLINFLESENIKYKKHETLFEDYTRAEKQIDKFLDDIVELY